MLFRLSFSLLLLAACVSHDGGDPAPGTEGDASLTLLRADGVSTPVSVAGPPGELRLHFTDYDTKCVLSLDASQPRRGDLTTDAKRDRVVVSLDVPVADAPGVLEGMPVVAKIRAPFLLERGSVALDLPGDDGVRETWTALGRGTLAIDPLVAGRPTAIALDAVAMHRTASGKKPALEGVLSGTLHATIAAPVRILAGGTCPTDP